MRPLPNHSLATTAYAEGDIPHRAFDNVALYETQDFVKESGHYAARRAKDRAGIEAL